MIKKLLLTLFMTFSLINVAQAKLNFSHASVIVVCNDFEAAMTMFQVAQNMEPVSTVVGCYGDRSFGSPISSQAIQSIKQISATALDWEGDPFALFKVNDQNIWLIVYNPDRLNTSVQVD